MALTLLITACVVEPRVEGDVEVHLQKKRVNGLTNAYHLVEEGLVQLGLLDAAQHAVQTRWRVFVIILFVDVDAV